MMRGVAAVALVATLWTVGFAGCLDDGHVPFCGGEPIAHDGVRFAWPPHLASNVTRMQSAQCLALRTGIAMDVIIVEGESRVAIDHTDRGTLLMAAEPSGRARGFFEAKVSPERDEPICTISQTGDDPPREVCADPVPRDLVVGWPDRPNVLQVNHWYVRWVLGPGELAASDAPAETARTIMDRLGLSWNMTAPRAFDQVQNLMLGERDVHVPRASSDAHPGLPPRELRQTVVLKCGVCTSYVVRSNEVPRATSETLEWAVDPDGDVLWASLLPAPAWDRMEVLSLGERDAAVDAFLAEHRLLLPHPVMTSMMLAPDWRPYWKVDVRYIDHQGEYGGLAIMQLDGLTGNWTLEVDAGLVDVNGTTTYPLTAAYKDSGYWR